MIFITVRFKVRPEYRDRWLSLVDDFTRGTRSEPGNLWFDWSRSVDDPDEFVLLEAFRDDDAGAAHVGSAHFAQAMKIMPPALAQTPRIINTQIPGENWSLMGELEIPATAGPDVGQTVQPAEGEGVLPVQEGADGEIT